MRCIRTEVLYSAIRKGSTHSAFQIFLKPSQNPLPSRLRIPRFAHPWSINEVQRDFAERRCAKLLRQKGIHKFNIIEYVKTWYMKTDIIDVNLRSDLPKNNFKMIGFTKCCMVFGFGLKIDNIVLFMKFEWKSDYQSSFTTRGVW